MGRLFGTDGVRGVANTELTPELAFKMGRAGAAVLLKHLIGDGVKRADERPRVVVGRDTRVSGEMLEAAMIAGFTSVGVDAESLGIIPTPAVAHLTRAMAADAGVMISASHNPVADNGIKFFSGDGYKLSDAMEEEIEGYLLGPAGEVTLSGDDGLPRPTGIGVGRARQIPDAADRFAAFLTGTAGRALSGLKVVLDCGCGAAWSVAPKVFAALGAEVYAFNAEPDGARINVGCGSTRPEGCAAEVKRLGAACGFAFDGDADRVIAIDERGEIVDGDHVLAICGLEMMRQGRLPGGRIAATVYSNLGLKEAFQKAGGDVVVTKAGDRYVLEAMREEGLALGGEQSGHIIFLEHNTTGDGVLTAIQLAVILKETGSPLSKLAGVMRTFPQILENVRVPSKDGLAESSEVAAAVAQAEQLLSPDGRIFIRPSGTEPLIRVMGEGPDEGRVRQAVDLVCAAVRSALR